MWYERDRDGTVMVTEGPNGKESRKRVSASPTAAVTPSRQPSKPLYNREEGGGYFLREGHQWDDGQKSAAENEREEADHRKQELRISEKLAEKLTRHKVRNAKRAAR